MEKSERRITRKIGKIRYDLPSTNCKQKTLRPMVNLKVRTDYKKSPERPGGSSGKTCRKGR